MIDHKSLGIHSLTYRDFLQKQKDCLSQVGVDTTQCAGHSLRRGGTSFAFQAGIPIQMIELLGDWKLDGVLLYFTVPLNIRL